MAPVLLLHVYSLVLAISSLTGTLAQVCTSSNPSYHISSQDQLDVLAQNCTVLDSPFYIESNYTGSSFVLHNVTNISQNVVFEWSETWPRSQGPISVEFPDLIHAKSIGLWEAVSLTKLSLPKLEYVETFSTFGVWGMPDLEFPSLRNTSRISLQGNISRVSFPALKTVHGALLLDNTSDPSMRTMNTNPLTIDLSLPVLEKAYEIEVRGTVARMSAPELTTVNNPRTDYGELILDLQGDAKALSLPKLSAVGGSMGGWVELSGNLSSLSLPSLRNLPPEFTIWPNAPLDIELAVEYGERISIGGPIKSASLPSLRNFTRVHVTSTTDIDCGSFIRGLKENVTAVEVDEDRNVSCYSAAVVLRVLGARSVLAIAVVIALVEFL